MESLRRVSSAPRGDSHKWAHARDEAGRVLIADLCEAPDISMRTGR